MIVLMHKYRLSLMIISAIMLHFFWGVLGLIDADALGGTASAGIVAVFSSRVAPWLCIGVAAMATWGFFIPPGLARMGMMIPQQVLLMISAGAVGKAIYLGSFADGVIRSRYFIAGDQVIVIIVGICHTVAIFRAALDKGGDI